LIYDAEIKFLFFESLQELPTDMTPAQRCKKKVRFVSFYNVKAYSGSMIIDPLIPNLELSLNSGSGRFSPGKKKNLVAVEKETGYFQVSSGPLRKRNSPVPTGTRTLYRLPP
jgi:hypothetical protein